MIFVQVLMVRAWETACVDALLIIDCIREGRIRAALARYLISYANCLFDCISWGVNQIL